MKLLTQKGVLSFVVSFFCALCFASDKFFDDPQWFLEVSGDRSWLILGSNEERRGLTTSLEWSREGRLLALRGRPDFEARETLSIRLVVNRSEKGDGETFNAFWLTLGAMWVGRGKFLENYYFEIGSGPYITDRTTQDINSHFNFGTYLGFGKFLESKKNAPRVGVRFTHVSNGGIEPPNVGMNLLQITLAISI